MRVPATRRAIRETDLGHRTRRARTPHVDDEGAVAVLLMALASLALTRLATEVKGVPTGMRLRWVVNLRAYSMTAKAE